MNRPEHFTTRALLAALALLTTLSFAQGLRAGDLDVRQIERGKYLVTIAACHDCHTPMKDGPNGPEPDMDRMLSGHPETKGVPVPALFLEPWDTQVSGMTAWTGFWGRSFSANLTPDPETGLGKWTERNFIDTIRNGRHLGRGRPLQPPMPWQMYRNMTDEDLAAVFAFLQSIPAVKNRVPEPLPPPAPTQVTSAGK